MHVEMQRSAAGCARVGLSILALVALPYGDALAQAYPARPVRLIVPFAAGGGGDGAARPLAQALSSRLGQQFVIDNRGGAGGLIGMETAATAVPDGYTLLLSTAGFAAMPALHRKLAFDPVKDFAGVVVAVSGMYLLVVSPASPHASVKALIDHARANPRKVDFASAGVGSTIHLAGELLKSMAKIEMTHVPYKGASPAITDIIGGQVQTMFASASNALPLVRSGRLRALAVTSAKRSALAPDVPTVAESGVPGYEVTGWYGLAAPARTPKPVVQQLAAETTRALKAPDFVERLLAQGLEPVGGTPEEATALIRADVARWLKVARESGIRGD